MIVFTNPPSNQIMAVYTHDTESTVWADRGYKRHVVTDPAAELLVRQLGRDGVAVFDRGKIVDVTPSVNPVQPEPDPAAARLGDLRDKITADTATVADLREYTRLRDGLS